MIERLIYHLSENSEEHMKQRLTTLLSGLAALSNLAIKLPPPLLSFTYPKFTPNTSFEGRGVNAGRGSGICCRWVGAGPGKGPGFGSGDARQGKSLCGFMLGSRDTWDGVG